MNKKVLKTMIALVVIFLVALYVLKIFFPQEFVMAIETKGLVKIGQFVDSHIWAHIIVGTVIGIIFDYLYFGAVCQRLRLNWILMVVIVLYNTAYSLFVYLAPVNIVMEASNILVCISVVYMILLPILFSRNLLPLSITYCINYVSQTLSLEIRNIGLLMLNATSITMILMSIECYFWMLLCFLLFNYRKGENKNGTL